MMSSLFFSAVPQIPHFPPSRRTAPYKYSRKRTETLSPRNGTSRYHTPPLPLASDGARAHAPGSGIVRSQRGGRSPSVPSLNPKGSWS